MPHRGSATYFERWARTGCIWLSPLSALPLVITGLPTPTSYLERREHIGQQRIHVGSRFIQREPQPHDDQFSLWHHHNELT